MSAKVGYLVIDAADPVALARFWCGLLAVTVDTEIGEGEFLVMSPTEDGLTVGFQRVADAKLGKNRVHQRIRHRRPARLLTRRAVLHGAGPRAGPAPRSRSTPATRPPSR